MKPVIIGMGPAKSHPADAWHPEALSTSNLCCLITGTSTNWSTVESCFDTIDLNTRWHREGSSGDSILARDAEETLRTLITAGGLRGGRKVFLLGEQVTNFVLAFLRRGESALASEGWRRLPKCVGYRLCTEDDEARVGKSPGYYDFVAIPVWHPRILTAEGIKMPPGWQQKMMNALRAAGGLERMRFKWRQYPTAQDFGKKIPADLQFPGG